MTGKAPDICIYHANCDDGFAAAYAVWKRFGDAVKFIPAQYGGDIPDVAGKDVLIVDFSFKQAEMQRLAGQARRLIVLDHHKTAEAELSGFTRMQCVGGPFEKRRADRLLSGVGVCFDMNKSGCRLAWEYCFGDEPMPEWFAAVEDRDLWRFALPATKEICISIRSHPRDFQIWDGFDAGELAVEGTAIRRYVDMIVSNICDTAFVEQIGGHDVPVAACSYDFVPETANQLLLRNPDAPFAACIVRSFDGITYSLRSMDDRMDVSEIAKANGGGGHRNAAGFRLKNTPPQNQTVGSGDRIADAIEACDWSGAPIGNKEILKAAVAELRSLQSWQRGAISCREAEEARIEEYRKAAEKPPQTAGQMMPNEPTAEILRAFDIAAERIDTLENAPIHLYRREVYLTMLEIAAKSEGSSDA